MEANTEAASVLRDETMTWEDYPVLHARFQMPLPRRPASRIARYYEQEAETFLRLCRHRLLPEASLHAQEALSRALWHSPWQVQLIGETKQEDEDFLSLLRVCRTEADGESLISQSGDTWAFHPVIHPVVSACALCEAKALRRILRQAGDKRVRYDPKRFYLEGGEMVFLPSIRGKNPEKTDGAPLRVAISSVISAK